MKRGENWRNQLSRLWQRSPGLAGRWLWQRWWRGQRYRWQGQRQRLDHWYSEFALFTQHQQLPAREAHSGLLNCRSRHARPSPSPWLATILVIVLLTATCGQRFYNQPQLVIGTTAPRTFVAPNSAEVPNDVATEERRRDAERGTFKVWQIDVAQNQAIAAALESSLSQIAQIRQQAGVLPIISATQLPLAAQQALRRASLWEWQAMWELAQQPAGDTTLTSPTTTSQRQLTPLTAQRTLTALRTYLQTATDAEISTLRSRLDTARNDYATATQALRDLNPERAADLYPPAWLDLSLSEWQTTRAEMNRILTQITAQGIAPGTPPDLLAEAVRLQVTDAEIPAIVQDAARLLIERSLEPNLVEDEEKTLAAAQKAAAEVEPVIESVDRGEIIVTEGETISSAAFAKLDYFNLSQREFNRTGFFGFGIAMTGAVALFLWVEHISHPGLRRRDYVLVVLLVLTNPLLSAIGINWLVSLPAIGLLAGTFYGAAVGTSLVLLSAVMLPLGLEVSSIPLAAAAVGGVIGSVMASRLRSREELALLGGGVGLTQAIVYLLLTMAISPGTAPVWYALLANAAFYGFVGLCWSVVALGLSPYLEHVFDLVTAIRLAELSNPNRPLLKRLAAEAPGTFQHTMFVASLAEAAARALNCNVELVRAGTLYHDIGKMHDPLGFIENQMGGPNKHDSLNDPWVSADIIRKHVTEGIVMAKKHRLPKAVRAFIPEHQGTMLITYFHHQATELAAADATIHLNDDDFRYVGPIPQSRETGIVMLADSCEAVLRSLKDATPTEAFSMVNRILRARWKDQQLIDSGLSRDDMDTIAKVFVRVWQQFNHQRIPYPKAAVNSK